MGKELQIPGCDLALYTVAPPVSSITLLSGWTETHTTSLKSAVQQIVDKNPVLTGAIKKYSDTDVKVENYGKYKDFVIEIDGPTDFPIPKGTENAIKIVHSTLEPLFQAHSIGGGQKNIDEGNELFRVILMKLPDNHMAHVIEMSHLIGDGSTYYKICKQLDCAMKGKPITELQWVPSNDKVAWPATYNDEDRALAASGWLPGFVEKIGFYAPGSPDARKATVNVINPHAIAKLKEEYAEAAQAMGAPFLSTNDLITAGVCEVTEHEIAGMYADMRGKDPSLKDTLAGNYERMVQFPSKKGANPAFIRSKACKDWAYYTVGNNGRVTEGKAKEAWLKCELTLITNWSTLTNFVEPPDTKVVCHCAPCGFVEGLPALDLGIIFKADNEGTICMIENWTAGKRGRELDKQIQTSKIFKRLFTPPSLWPFVVIKGWVVRLFKGANSQDPLRTWETKFGYAQKSS